MDTGALISLEGIERRYPGPPEVLALRDASFAIQAGEYVAVTGPSGSGKSTLLNILGLLTRPTAGRYILNGQDVTAVSEAGAAGIRAHWIGVIFQSFHLLNDRSATTNVMMGALYGGHALSKTEIQHRAAEALDQVGLSHRAYALPSTLSGGERQRVAIARALMMRPRILLCDEPTGNLDSRTTEEILDVFSTLGDAGQTLVMITHSPDVAARAGRRLEVLDGRVKES